MRSARIAAQAILQTTLCIALLAGSARADGRLEINQVSVDAAGGFPLVLDEPGNYRLTSALAVPAGTDGIVLMTTDIVLDLNGFSIVGPATCDTSACSTGTGMGIRSGPSVAFGHYTTVRNGTVRGFADSCVTLGRNAKVADLLVRQCGGFGISVNTTSSVTGNRVTNTGRTGIRMSPGTVYAHNAVAAAGLAGGGELSYDGGTASAGNSCSDEGCAPRGERRFYLTQSIHDGSTALSACSFGFHMASLFEIHDVSKLHYDLARGFVGLDQGAGPPTSERGWIRTGMDASNGSSVPGVANCAGWTSTTSGFLGTLAQLPNDWEEGSPAPGSIVDPWRADPGNCAASSPVWCVED